MPGWQLDLLDRAWPLLQAEELIQAMTAARAALADQKEYERLMKRLKRMAEPYSEAEPIKMAEGQDKALAAEFFKNMGMRTA